MMFAFYLKDKLNKKNNISMDIDKEMWQKNLIMPGEVSYDSENDFYHRFGGVIVCYIGIYRFIVLMNIRLSYWGIIGILSGLLSIFYVFEQLRYKKQMDEDRDYLYEKIADQIFFADGMNWRDLLDFQILSD